MRVTTKIAAGMLAALALAGCSSGEHEDIKQWMAESSKDLRGRAPPLPELRPFPIAPYDAQNLPDPFSMARVEPDRKEATGINQPDLNRPKEQLETFPLDALQFTGMLKKGARQERRGLVRAGTALYQVGIGNYMGQNFGRVVAIDDTAITLIETVQDPSGQTSAWVEREVTLSLEAGAATQGGGK